SILLPRISLLPYTTLFRSLHSSYGDIEEMPIEVFYRDKEDFPELEFIALSLCDGKVLDVGAGVGSHVLYLQEKNFDVTALEVSRSEEHTSELQSRENIVCR